MLQDTPIHREAEYVPVLSPDTILNIENHSDAKVKAELEQHAGKTATVNGTLSKDGRSVKVSSIQPGS
jgi:hypothetical protein